ncbi:hypothetical protein B0I32_15023 [Nonomuraea fuscirosea]|uniref:Uncharacterized protein n=1 Tax=Nonomuraea fuscirosea TaxID=1291556 RepID=A0A2T0LNQ4_9ACTN|nr:hypothetical protein B0I32_15023 [Nonomuraea fuscirosea]
MPTTTRACRRLRPVSRRADPAPPTSRGRNPGSHPRTPRCGVCRWVPPRPDHKTSRAFSKPVDPIVGELIQAWQAVRPPQPDITDRKTGQRRQHLFCYRAQLVGLAHLHNKLIPILCRKAGIPESDSRGALTSHRACATIATQLLNAPQRPRPTFPGRPAAMARPQARRQHPPLRRDPHRRCRRRQPAVEVLPPARGLLQLRLLRQVPAPPSLRSLSLLPAQRQPPRPITGGQGRHRPDARTARSNRRRTRSTRARPRCRRRPHRQPRRHLDPPQGRHPASSATPARSSP